MPAKDRFPSAATPQKQIVSDVPGKDRERAPRSLFALDFHFFECAVRSGRMVEVPKPY
jgi:hypothetical protein